MKKSHFMWLAVPVCLYLPWMIPGCAGTLTDEEIADARRRRTTSTGTGRMRPPEWLLSTRAAPRPTALATGRPPIMGLDLTIAGIAAAHDGDDFVGRATSNDMANGAACSPMSTPPVMGKLIVDPDEPRGEPALHKNVGLRPNADRTCRSCRAKANRRPFPRPIRSAILDWIKTLTGVGAGTVGAGAGGSSGTAGAGGSAAGCGRLRRFGRGRRWFGRCGRFGWRLRRLRRRSSGAGGSGGSGGRARPTVARASTRRRFPRSRLRGAVHLGQRSLIGKNIQSVERRPHFELEKG